MVPPPPQFGETLNGGLGLAVVCLRFVLHCMVHGFGMRVWGFRVYGLGV